MKKIVLFYAFLICLQIPSTIHATETVHADTLYQQGMALFNQNNITEAEILFQKAIQIKKKHFPAFVGLGHVYFKRDSLRLAEDTFKKARSLNQNYAPTYNGLGLVALQRPKDLHWAIDYFRKATKKDPTYTEAYYNLALAYHTIGDTKELDTYEELTQVSPNHPDAWFQIGRIHRDGKASQFNNLQKAENAYRKQLEIYPQHWGAMVHLGGVLKTSGKTDEAISFLQKVANAQNPYQRQAIQELAQVYQKRREYDQAETLFNAYIDSLKPEEQAVYYDLSLVAQGDELAQFKTAPQAQWKSLSETFWSGRDPAPVTEANERRIEHHRRVVYAREHFGEFQFPYDVRGDVYIRYGQPDHMSASDDIRFETDPRVLAVKNRLLLQAGEAAELLLLNQRMVQTYGGLPGEKNEVGTMEDKKVLPSLLGSPVYPVKGVWEYWIYTGVEQGIEVVFVQKHHQNPYIYAPIPAYDDIEYIDPMTGVMLH